MCVVAPVYNDNLTVYPPVSIGYAFYPFDSNTLDLYCRRDGAVDEGSVSYVSGYVATGQAILFNQSVSTRVVVANPFNLTSNGLTIEAFVILLNSSSTSNLVRFSSGVALTIEQGLLKFILNAQWSISSRTTISLNQWHHVAAVYNAAAQVTNIYLDGRATGQLGYLAPPSVNNTNATLIIGSMFEGVIDQLSIALEAKTDAQILWDASAAAYFPLEGDSNGWLLDYGPNVLNATSGGTQLIPGHIRGALNFTVYGAFFQTPGLTPLTFPDQPFTVAFWIRLSTQSGVILTISNSESCLLVLGIRTVDQRLVAYLPESKSNIPVVNMIGSKTTADQWVHVAFTWSTDNLAQLYQAAALDVRNTEARQLNQNGADPMIVSVGMYRGKANCSGADGFNLSQHFLGALDEFYIFNRELAQGEIEKLSQTTYS